MRKGPRPKPTARKILEGNPGRRPLNQHEPEFPPPVEDTTPLELHGDAVALKEWARVSPLLETARVTTEADRGALIALCQQWSQYLDATRQTARVGMVVMTPSKYPIVNPYLSIANRALLNCVKLWAELGLTPSSRTRVSTVPPVGWTGHSPVARPQTTLAKLQEQAAALRRPLGVKQP